MTKQFLHVGCGKNRKEHTTYGFNRPEWKEIRFDIDESVDPDIVGTMLDMSAVESGSMDALYSAHNIEHLYPHEVPLALAEFKRVLKPEGFLVLTCPDLQKVCEFVVQDKLTDVMYNSPAGPITPMDVLFGHRIAMAAGNLFMAHRVGFTENVLRAALRESGFTRAATAKRGHPSYDLWAVALPKHISDDELRALAGEHFPKHKPETSTA